MLGSLRLSGKSLLLILTVLFFTVSDISAQQPQINNSPKQNTESESTLSDSLKNSLSDSLKNSFETKVFDEKETRFSAASVVNKPAAEHNEEEEVPDTIRTNYVYKHKRGATEYNVEFGVSPLKPARFAGPREYDIDHRKMLTLDVRIGRTLGTVGPVTYAYMFGVTPLVVAFKNEVGNPAYVSPTATPNVAPTHRETSYGFGVTPANFRFTFMPNRRIKPFLKLGAGALFFNKPVPVPYAGRIHFQGDWGGGLIIHPKDEPKKFFTIGARYLHLSNANVHGRRNNPGYNAITFYLGFSVFK